ncbi:MAG TPA: hypothetical protein VJ461_05125 [Candidatus Nanoarchaeia archaeon]|nr:hypothetical protein [Candidatus Nanoarchaeia archaeon]
MGFKSEEDIEVWFALEKERLEQEFLQSINKDKEKIPKYKEKYNAEMKRLLAKYEAESLKMLERRKSGKQE